MTDVTDKLESLIEGQELGPVESMVLASACNEIECLRARLAEAERLLRKALPYLIEYADEYSVEAGLIDQIRGATSDSASAANGE